MGLTLFLHKLTAFLQNQLKITSSELIFENMTFWDLQTAAEMFLFLNSCPKDFKSWFLFYEDLFQNDPLEVMVLKLNRILKGNFKNMNSLL